MGVAEVAHGVGGREDDVDAWAERRRTGRRGRWPAARRRGAGDQGRRGAGEEASGRVEVGCGGGVGGQRGNNR